MDASRHVGDVELTPNPTVAANVINMEDIAAAPKAPAIIGVHCKDHPLAPSLTTGLELSVNGSTFIGVSSIAGQRMKEWQG
jgi:hypothetical protein